MTWLLIPTQGLSLSFSNLSFRKLATVVTCFFVSPLQPFCPAQLFFQRASSYKDWKCQDIYHLLLLGPRETEGDTEMTFSCSRERLLFVLRLKRTNQKNNHNSKTVPLVVCPTGHTQDCWGSTWPGPLVCIWEMAVVISLGSCEDQKTYVCKTMLRS